MQFSLSRNRSGAADAIPEKKTVKLILTVIDSQKLNQNMEHANNKGDLPGAGSGARGKRFFPITHCLSPMALFKSFEIFFFI
jgi:hypothetical protein